MCPVLPYSKTTCSSILQWNDDKAYLIISIRENKSRSSLFRRMIAEIQWQSTGATSANYPINSYTVIVTLDELSVTESVCYIPKEFHYFVPFEGNLCCLDHNHGDVASVYCYQNGQFQNPPVEFAKKFLANSQGLTDQSLSEGWNFDLGFSPGAFRESKKNHIFHDSPKLNWRISISKIANNDMASHSVVSTFFCVENLKTGEIVYSRIIGDTATK